MEAGSYRQRWPESGTNQVHGTAYAFGRDTPLDARNYFNPISQAKNPRNLEQFGGTFGGALIKNRLFYFGGYEGQRYTVGNTGSLATWSTVPLPDAGNCAFSGTGDCANSIPDAIADVHAAFLAGAIPNDLSAAQPHDRRVYLRTAVTRLAATAAASQSTPATVPTADQLWPAQLREFRQRSWQGRLSLGTSGMLSGCHFFGNNSGTVSDASQLQKKWLHAEYTLVLKCSAKTWTYVAHNARWVNEAARASGYNAPPITQPGPSRERPQYEHHGPQRGSTFGPPAPLTVDLTCAHQRVPKYCIPAGTGRLQAWPKVQGRPTRIQFIDAFHHVVSPACHHQVLAGETWRRDSFSGAGYGGARGRIRFGASAPNDAFAEGIEDFFAGVPSNGTLLIGDPRATFTIGAMRVSFRPDFRVTTNVTINFGLRNYEVNTVIRKITTCSATSIRPKD